MSSLTHSPRRLVGAEPTPALTSDEQQLVGSSSGRSSVIAIRQHADAEAWSPINASPEHKLLDMLPAYVSHLRPELAAQVTQELLREAEAAVQDLGGLPARISSTILRLVLNPLPPTSPSHQISPPPPLSPPSTPRQPHGDSGSLIAASPQSSALLVMAPQQQPSSPTSPASTASSASSPKGKPPRHPSLRAAWGPGRQQRPPHTDMSAAANGAPPAPQERPLHHPHPHPHLHTLPGLGHTRAPSLLRRMHSFSSDGSTKSGAGQDWDSRQSVGSTVRLMQLRGLQSPPWASSQHHRPQHHVFNGHLQHLDHRAQQQQPPEGAQSPGRARPLVHACFPTAQDYRGSAPNPQLPRPINGAPPHIRPAAGHMGALLPPVAGRASTTLSMPSAESDTCPFTVCVRVTCPPTINPGIMPGREDGAGSPRHLRPVPHFVHTAPPSPLATGAPPSRASSPSPGAQAGTPPPPALPSSIQQLGMAGGGTSNELCTQAASSPTHACDSGLRPISVDSEGGRGVHAWPAGGIHLPQMAEGASLPTSEFLAPTLSERVSNASVGSITSGWSTGGRGHSIHASASSLPPHPPNGTHLWDSHTGKQAHGGQKLMATVANGSSAPTGRTQPTWGAHPSVPDSAFLSSSAPFLHSASTSNLSLPASRSDSHAATQFMQLLHLNSCSYNGDGGGGARAFPHSGGGAAPWASGSGHAAMEVVPARSTADSTVVKVDEGLVAVAPSRDIVAVAAQVHLRGSPAQPTKSVSSVGEKEDTEEEGAGAGSSGEEGSDSGESDNSEEDVHKAVLALLRKQHPGIAAELMAVMQAKCSDRDLLIVAASPRAKQASDLDAAIVTALHALLDESCSLARKVCELETSLANASTPAAPAAETDLTNTLAALPRPATPCTAHPDLGGCCSLGLQQQGVSSGSQGPPPLQPQPPAAATPQGAEAAEEAARCSPTEPADLMTPHCKSTPTSATQPGTSATAGANGTAGAPAPTPPATPVTTALLTAAAQQLVTATAPGVAPGSGGGTQGGAPPLLAPGCLPPLKLGVCAGLGPCSHPSSDAGTEITLAAHLAQSAGRMSAADLCASADITSTMADTGSALSTSPNLHGSGSLLVRSRRLRAHTHTHSAGQVQAASANVRAVGPAGPPHSPGPGPVGLAEMGEDGERGGHVGNGVAGQGQQEGKAGESCEVGNSNDSSVKMGGSRDHTWSSDPEAVDRHSSMHIANKSRSSNSSTSIEHSSCRSNNHSGSHGVGRSAGNGLLQKQDSGQGGVLSPLGALSNVEGDGVVVAGGRPDGLQQQLQRVGGEEPQMPPTCACSIM